MSMFQSILLQSSRRCTSSRIICSKVFYSSVSNQDSLPTIRFPQGIKRKIDKNLFQKRNKKRGVLQLARPGKQLISSNEKYSSMYTNEYVTKFKPPSLTSTNWRGNKSAGKYFTIHPTKTNPSMKEDLNSSFREMGLSNEIIKALRIMDIAEPSVIQNKAISEIMQGKNTMFAAETGCGKTYAYLLPIINNILQQTPSLEPSCVKTLVLVPTKELCEQVKLMVNKLELSVSCRTLHSSSMMGMLQNLKTGTDILVATPIPFILAIRKSKVDLSTIQHLVIDECDTLLDDSFSTHLCNILSRINIHDGLKKPIANHDKGAQLILCSATFPKYAGMALENIIVMDELTTVRSGYLHRISPHVTHHFLRVKPSLKPKELVSILKKALHDQTIVFCNFARFVKQICAVCKEHGIPAIGVEKNVKPSERSAILNGLKNGEHKLVVTTDILSRGLDLSEVKQVINYDVPTSVSDYIHRSGRVGRINHKHDGKIINLVSYKWELPVVMKIEEAARRREEIIGVSGNIKRKHERRWERNNNKMF